jgi:hypothetical protein
MMPWNADIAVRLGLSFVLIFCVATSRALEQPDCTALTNWARGVAAGENFEAAPGISVNRAFEDSALVPLLGRGVLFLSREDVSSFMGWLNSCRGEVLRAGDKESGQVLYEGIKEAKQLSRAMRPYWGAQKLAERNVDNLVSYRASPGLAEVLRLAEDALNGQAVSAAREDFAPELYGSARQAASLSEQAPLLPDEMRQALVAKLAGRRTELENQEAEQAARYDQLIAQIEAVPNDATGLAQLNRLASQVDLNDLSREQQQSYNAVFQARRTAIQQQLNSEKAAADRARLTMPAPAAERMAAVLRGEAIDELSFLGIAPGMRFTEARSVAQEQLGYIESTYLGEADKQVTPRRSDYNRYLEEQRRDGGLMNFYTRDSVVGKVAYVEHFPGPLETGPLAAALRDRFGSPDDDATGKRGLLDMTWRDDGSVLQVIAGNAVTQDRQYMKLQSSMQILLWTEDFEDYLEEARARCQRLARTPADRLSAEEKQAVLMGCKTP